VRLNDYYEGDQRSCSSASRSRRSCSTSPVILNWPRVTVDGCEQRLDVVGFRLGKRPAGRLPLAAVAVQRPRRAAVVAHTDALALGRSFLCLGTNEDDPEFPLVTIESPLEMATIRDPRTRQVTAALRLYGEQSEAAPTQQTADMNATHATLYLPNVDALADPRPGQLGPRHDPDEHGSGRAGRPDGEPRTGRRSGARVRRGRLGDERRHPDRGVRVAGDHERAARAGDPRGPAPRAARRDEGRLRPPGRHPDRRVRDLHVGALTALANPAGKAVQFDASDLSNFETMVNLYARQASGVDGMPIEYFGLNTQNAPSARGSAPGRRG
jgi:hypothetical protein